MKALLDANFLIDTIKFKVDIDDIRHLVPGPCSLFTLSSVIRELERISLKRTRAAAHAKAALNLVRYAGISVIDSRIQTDKALASLSREYIIATNDKKLRKEIRAAGGKTIYLKSKKHLAMD